MHKHQRLQKYIPESEGQQAKYEKINQEVNLKVKLNEVLKDISNLVLSFINKVKQILVHNQIRFQINRQWAHKIIMNVISPVQIRAPVKLPTDSTKIFSKIQLMHYNLNHQKVKQKKSPQIENKATVKKNRSSYPLLDGICFENADPSKDYPTKLGKDAEMIINKWIIKEYEQGRIIGGDEIRQRALQMSKKLGIKFQASRGWLRRYFMRNYEIYCLLHNAADKSKNNKKLNDEIQYEEIYQSQMERIQDIKEQESQLMKKKQIQAQQKKNKVEQKEQKKQIIEKQKQNGQESCIYISRKDVRKIIKKNMKYLSESDIERIINNLDPNKSGRISEFDLENLDNLSL